MDEFLILLLSLSAAGSLMIILLLALRYIFLRKMPATVYYYLWILVLLRFVLPIPSFLPTKTLMPASDYIVEQPYQEVPDDDFDRQYVQPAIFNFSNMQGVPVNNTQPLPTAMPVNDSIDFVEIFRALPWTEMVLALWLAGFIISLGRYIIGYLRFSSLIRKSRLRPELDDTRCYSRLRRSKKPELIRSDYVRTPMLMGVFRPLLVLPDADYTQTQLENIFLHELMHYSRRDILYKWLSVPVFAMQWFNPLSYLMRREINRACELSCDEMLIGRMDRERKQAYGDTLISLASAGRLPAGIVATTFTTEKRYLKERLVKIMKFKEKTFTSVLALVLSVLLLTGCGAVAGPAPAEKSSPETRPQPLAAMVNTDEPADDEDAVVVSTVDEFLAAIAPDTTIRLKPGIYDLSLASDYGDNQEGKYYSWEETYDGHELVIPGVDGLRIIGSYVDTTIATQPRYANVLRFVNCTNISLEDVVIGHTEGQGFCSGGVVYLDSCRDVNFDSCHLFGCGTIGIYAQNCKRVYAEKSAIYDCSYNAVYAVSCSDVRLDSCDIYDCGENTYGGQSVFTAESAMGFAVVNSKIYNNTVGTLLDIRYSKDVNLLGCEIRNNIITDSVFCCDTYPATVEDCSFEKNHYTSFNTLRNWVNSVEPVDAEGNTLTEDELLGMTRADAVYEGPKQAETVPLDEVYNEDGQRLVTVETVDEFLAAIGDDTTISLIGDVFDLSTAANYGAYGSDNYYWINVYDGPGLVISGVKNLRIVGNEATIAAIPRYANVIGFVNCENISIENLTAGHTQEPGECAGGVLDFQNCNDMSIIDCHLYGCGILGISTANCSNLYVGNTEIYECSQGAIALYATRGAEFVNCDIHDCYTPEITLHDCSDVSYDGETLKNYMYTIENGKAVEFEYDW